MTQGGGLVAIGIGIAMLGSFGTGLGQGLAAGKATEAVGRNPEAAAKIRSMLLIGQGVAESSAIYCLVVAFILAFAFTK
ncbi:ATP synthase F0 subunit C [Mycoplasmopsis fermentans]|nr:ATP synthase F0 subunit C [Mycoplasmopsis fermentans]ADN68827.1 ATP synthase C chain [Mycoplasmopsis fermentans JER]ADV34272.1 ATP synthase subunit c [Mycoplasmopsis fermentans M64]VEU60297.1 ATP synthase C chain [Mycoplasmopsis fermentans]VEU67438.1 ATP synthase C chain [Mesomycoplasma conjunctivae]